MSSKRKPSFSFGEMLRESNFKKIKIYITQMCNLMIGDKQSKNLKVSNDENMIRNILLNEYMKSERYRHLRKGYLIDPEVSEHYDGMGYKGRVDLRIKLRGDFEKDDAYYIVECKRIDGGVRLNTAYVEEGVRRFVSQKYSSYYKRNFMLGFVVESIDIPKNVSLIEKIQNKATDSEMHGKMEFSRSDGFSSNYRCVYTLSSESIELCHIFSDFSAIVS